MKTKHQLFIWFVYVRIMVHVHLTYHSSSWQEEICATIIFTLSVEIYFLLLDDMVLWLGSGRRANVFWWCLAYGGIVVYKNLVALTRD